MTQKEYLQIFAKECEEELKLTTAKNADYANDNDAFKNFRAIEFLSSSRISVEDGIVVRLTDKFQRIINLLKRDATVKDETIIDTLRDLSVYAKILRIYLLSKNDASVSR